MASSTMLLLPPHPFHSLSFCSRTPLFSIKTYPRTAGGGRLSVSASSRALHALIFDCDGVILESEHLHRQAYNDAFTHFNVCCPSSSSSQSLVWSPEFYDVLQNQIGGGKPKMRWYFKENGWPTSKVFDAAPETDDDRAKLIDILQLIVEAVDLDRELHTYLIIGGNKSVTPLGEDQQLETAVPIGRGAEGRIHQRGSILGASRIRKQDWKTERYKEIIKSGTVEPRPGVLRLMDEAKAAGKKLAVCSAATKSSVILCLENLIGMERFQGLDCFLAGDDVKEKKPDPLIYITAAERLRVSEKDCLVVEDSVIGLQAATRAGMSCVITYTSSTANQDFKEAAAIYPDLSEVRLKDLESLLQNVVTAN